MELIDSKEYKECKEKLEKRAIKEVAEQVVKEEVEADKQQEIVKHQKKRLQSSLELAKEEDEVTKQICKTDLKKVVQKRSALFFFFSVVASIISVFMSCAGISNAQTFGELVDAATGRYWIGVLLMALLQTSVILYSFYSYALGLYHNDQNILINIYRFVVMAVSIYCNYLFIKGLVPEYGTHGIGKCIGLFLASGPDIISNLFSNTSTKMKYREYKHKGIMANGNEHVGIMEKLRILFFGNLLIWIDNAYQEKMATMQSYYGKNYGNAKNNYGNTVKKNSKNYGNTKNNYGNAVKKNGNSIEKNGKNYSNGIEKNGNAEKNYDNAKKITTHTERCYLDSPKKMATDTEDILENDEEFMRKKPECLDYVMDKLMEMNVKPGNRIRRGMVGLSVPEWKSLRRYMQLNGAFRCKLKSTFLEKDLREVKKELAG